MTDTYHDQPHTYVEPQNEGSAFHPLQEITEQSTVTNEPENETVRKMREVFDTARDAIIDTSRLAKVVAELQVTVNALKADVESYRGQIASMDATLNVVRSERDQAKEELTRVRGEAWNSRMKIEELTKERDDALLEGQMLHDENALLKAKLEAIEKALHPTPSFGESVSQTC